MERRVVLAVSALLCLAAGAAAAKENLAVLPFSGGMGNEGEAIAELFSFSSDLNAVFDIIPRTSISQAIVGEQNFQGSSGMTDPDSIARLGKQLGAKYVVAGSIAQLGSRNLLIISIINIEDLRQIAGDIQTYTRIEELQGKLPSIVRNIIDSTRIDAAGLSKLAVVPVDLGDNIDRRVADTLAQILSIYLIRSGRYAVYPRNGSLEQVQAEYKNQQSGITADKNVTGTGKGDNPRLVLSVAARKLGAQNMFNASILDLETGLQLSGGSENYNTLNDGVKAMENLARKLTGVSGPLSRTANSAMTENLGIGAMNLALGLGSFTQKDWVGGLTLLGGYAAGAGLIVWELSLAYEDDMAGVPGPIGIGVIGLTAAYGFIRPWLYHKNPAMASVADRIQIGFVPEKPGIVQLSYTVSF
ncbi:hypothetical protein FACS1894147_00140 [Spirochaetia bacterium]|nr:hypothetical protein FACS1894147_00140 [Spirochaetia bacterium]